MNDVKQVIASNISELRKYAGMTQLELAEKLNYSDKAVSKWERGESIPDVTVLIAIADLFSVPLDYLVRRDHEAPAPKTEAEEKLEIEAKRAKQRSRKAIMGVSIQLIFFIAMLIFVIISLVAPDAKHTYLCFLFAVPAASIVWLVFNSIWFNTRLNYLIISLLMWSTLACIHITVLAFGINIWMIYLLGLSGEMIIVMWSIINKRS